MQLSARRAAAVKDYVASKGISRSRIKIRANGEEKPVASNENSDGSDNPKGRSINRRVDVAIQR
ncbi:MAG TPA: OmpA family protein, partial [Bacteroidia bacterium]|nr:OmpA family protein [Bacteroidia bacterium]